MRLSQEKSKKHNYKVYVSVRENGGWEYWNMIKICDYLCNNKREAELKEDKYIMKLKANMNSHRAKYKNIRKNIMTPIKITIKNITKQIKTENKNMIKKIP
jgi:Fic family protein